MQPKKGMCSVNAHCLQEQRFSVHPGGVFVMQTDMRMEHIPYADCFKVQSFWKVCALLFVVFHACGAACRRHCCSPRHAEFAG
jgi:hypothetical protein